MMSAAPGDDHDALVTALAHLATVVAEHTAHEERLAVDLAAARERIAQLEGDLDIERRITSTDAALIDAIVSDGGFGALRTGMREALGRDVQLVDFTVRYDVRGEAAEIGEAQRPLFVLSASTGTPARLDRADGTVGTVMAATREGELVGGVMVAEAVTSADEPVLRRCATVLGAYLSALSRERGDIQRRRRELLELMLDPPPSGLSVVSLRHLDELGIREGQPFRILIADGSAASRHDFRHRLDLDFGLSLLAAEIGEQLIAVLPEGAFVRVEEMLAEPGARKWGTLLVSHSPKLHSFDIMPEEFALAVRVLEAARRTGEQRTLVSLASYGAIGAFLTRVTLEPTLRAVAEVLAPLKHYDANSTANLVDTAAAYLDAGRSVTRAAAQLHVHENTVRQRLTRIAELLGDDWSLGQRGLDFHIMLAVNRLLGP